MAGGTRKLRSGKTVVVKKARRTRKAKKTAKVTKPLQNAIKKVLYRQLETKYVAEQVQLSGYVIPADITPNIDFHTMLPKLSIQGATATNNQREGDTVMPIRARIAGHVWLDQSPAVAKIIYVKLYMVTPKAVKSNQTIGTTNPNSNLPDGLLDDGTQDPVKWFATGQDLQSFYPVNKENYTVMKVFNFKFANNGGGPIGQAVGASTNTGCSDRYSFTHSWTPPKLKYALDADKYPTNHNPIFFAVIYSPGFNCGTDASLTGAVKMNWNLDMSYKDA